MKILYMTRDPRKFTRNTQNMIHKMWYMINATFITCRVSLPAPGERGRSGPWLGEDVSNMSARSNKCQPDVRRYTDVRQMSVMSNRCQAYVRHVRHISDVRKIRQMSEMSVRCQYDVRQMSVMSVRCHWCQAVVRTCWRCQADVSDVRKMSGICKEYVRSMSDW